MDEPVDETEAQEELLAALNATSAQFRKGRPIGLLLAEPPLLWLPPGVSIRPHPVPLSRTCSFNPDRLRLRHWPEAAMEALRYPQIACVLQGEVDIRVANSVLTLGQGICWLVPPGVPCPDGTALMWDRPGEPPAPSRMLSLLITPFGARCHVLHATGDSRAFIHRVFVRDSHLPVLTECLMEELRSHAPGPDAVAQTYLLALLLRLQRDLASGGIVPDAAGAQALEGPHVTTAAVQRACAYIRRNLHRSLSVAEIASHAFLSPPHLQRLFHAEVGMSLMHYVTLCRAGRAKELLAHSELTVHEVGELVGLVHPSHFTRVFTRCAGVSPTEFRLHHASLRTDVPGVTRRHVHI
ncbi:MAG: helix-turn-helix transcriptional regulator [Armatimonadetes bacterium]|nr:helix-turn-helix transcriptional regulator [Armatimonadota bacterium]